MFTGLAASKAGTAREIIACNIIRILAQRERAAMSAGDRGPGAERGWHPRRQISRILCAAAHVGGRTEKTKR